MTRRSAASRRGREVACPHLLGLAILVVWETGCRLFAVPAFLFPRPSAVAWSLGHNLGTLSWALLSTLEVTLAALALAVLAGVGISFGMAQSRIAEISLFPYVVALQVTPIVAIVPLIVILVKNTETALVACATLIAIFPVISNTTFGLKSVDTGLANLFAINRATRLQVLLRLRIPSALPYFCSGLRISSGLSLIGAVVAEFVAGTGGRDSGLAYQIMQAGYQLDMPLMFAGLALITVVGIALFFLVNALTGWLLGSWHDSQQQAR